MIWLLLDAMLNKRQQISSPYDFNQQRVSLELADDEVVEPSLVEFSLSDFIFKTFKFKV